MTDQAATTTAHGVVQSGRGLATMQDAEQYHHQPVPICHLGWRQPDSPANGKELCQSAITVGLVEVTQSSFF